MADPSVITNGLGREWAMMGIAFKPYPACHFNHAFADATLDQQWIHTNPEMAKQGPFGGPIAHGLLSLSLLPYFSEQVAWAPRPKMSVNYGYDKVRFTAPLPSGSNVRSRMLLDAVEMREDGGLTIKVTHKIEREGALSEDENRPILIAESVGLFYY